MDSDDDPIETKIKKLGYRVKNTSTVRFAGSKRIRFNYSMANLTVIVLSLWAIFISYMLASSLSDAISINKPVMEAVGVVLPVFIVVFSLIEGGENLVRAHLMELNARQLRELGDKLFSVYSKAKMEGGDLVAVFEEYSHKYNDTLERSPINHDDIDHWGRYFAGRRRNQKEFTWPWLYYFFLIGLVWMRRQVSRLIYISLWLLPALFFLVPPEK